jgi:flagellar motor switch protein FliN
MTNSDAEVSTAQTDNAVKTEDKPAEKPAETTTATATEKPPEAGAADAAAAAPPAAAPNSKDASLFDPAKMGILNDVNIALSIEIGRSEIKIRDLLTLTKGSIIELNKLSGEPVEVYANGKLISLGEIITVNGKYCVKLSACTENLQMGAKSNGK